MNKIKDLNKYLENVDRALKASSGALKEFWLREERKTKSKIVSLTK